MTVDALSVLTPRLPVDISVNSKAMSDSLVFFFKKNIDLLTSFWLHGAFVAALGRSLVVGAGATLVAACGLLISVAARCRASQALVRGLSSCGTCGLGCLEACGIFPDQGSHPCLVHWQVDS